jgi:fibronectin type III domain protein
MKKTLFYFVALAFFASTLFCTTSCKKDDDPQPTPSKKIGDVENVTFTQVGNNTIFYWDAYENAMTYMLSIDGIPDSEEPIFTTFYDAGILLEGIDVTVEAFSDLEMESLIASTTVTFTKPNNGIIQNISYTEFYGSIMLNWDLYSGATGYMVSANGMPLSSYPISGTPFNCGALNNGDYLHIEAFDDLELSNLIAEGYITYESTITETQPDPIYNLSVVETGEYNISLQWNNPSTDFTNIEIYDGVRIPGNTSNRILSMDNTMSSANLSNLDSNTEYTFYIYCKNTNNTQEDKIYSEANSVTASTSGQMLSIVGTYWYHEAEDQYDIDMTMDFHEYTVTWVEGEYSHDLDYYWDPLTGEGMMDTGGYFEGEITTNENLNELNLMGFFDFVRISK